MSTNYNLAHEYFRAMCLVAEEMDRLNMNRVDDPNSYEEGSYVYQIAAMRRFVNGEIKRSREAMLEY